MASPLATQGSLNRLRGSVTFPLFPQLNVTASFLGEEGINLTLEGDIVDTLPTMTGTVTSPAPYQMATLEIALLKTQSLSNLFKTQIELLATVGPIIVRPDAATLGNYSILNGSITAAAPGRLNGKSADFVVSIKGYYIVNGSLYLSA